MKALTLLLLSVVFSTSLWAADMTPPPWNKSPELESLVVQLKNKYNSDELFTVEKRKMTQVDNLSYFIRFYDKPNAPEYKLLKAYLWGMQLAHSQSVNQQIQTNITPWFCPTGGKLGGVSPNIKNPTQFIENIIWEALEQDLRLKPARFKNYNGAAAFMSTSSLIQYGLQTKFPCYNTTPESHRLVGFNY
ncbi:hypothetical protein L1D61_27015 [Vibrio mediterranei]|uniref:Uncharacterized protein n=1 Tax=Vibrio mediterranei TaxID=689 RepID=A0A3G4VJK1_9VIBR|nr:hypothetical protein [Vibrio mediterranei]AYV24987.1 hypothetical protein ECB94_27085 [Vibrio mediterranei]MCG9790769.1 hypothetical protein [Vibrio mediterranei]